MTALQTSENEVAGLGHNRSEFDKIAEQIESLYEEARNWADGAEIESQEQHDAAKKVHDDLHKAGQTAEDLRVAEKAPLDEQINAIQARFNPYTQKNKGKVDLGKKALKEVMGKWREKEAARKREAAEKAAKEAEEKRRAAEAAIQTSRGNIEAREEAEALLDEAKRAEKGANKLHKTSITGTGLRKDYEPVLTSLRDAVAHYWKTNPAAFEDLVTTLAAKDVRAGFHSIPGFTVEERKKAI